MKKMVAIRNGIDFFSALRMADVLEDSGITADQMRVGYSPKFWRTVAAAAGCEKAAETVIEKAIVIGILSLREGGKN
jgi:hypothetical protein